MSFNVASPPDFLPFPGEPPIPWAQWKTTFKAFVKAKDINLTRQRDNGLRGLTDAQRAAVQQTPAYSDEEKNLNLYLYLGAEGQRKFQGTPDYANYDRTHTDVLRICDGLFEVRKNRRVALMNFRARKQRPDESVSDFAAELRLLAKDCKFTAQRENAEIADQLVLNCFDKETQLRLLSQHANSGYNEVLAFMLAEEGAKKDVAKMENVKVAAVRQQGSQDKKQKPGPSQKTAPTTPSSAALPRPASAASARRRRWR